MKIQRCELTQRFSIQDQEFNILVNQILTSALETKQVYIGKYVQMNANFIYLMSIFEKFLVDFNVYAVQKDSSVKAKYIAMFESLCEDKIRTLKAGRKQWTQYMNLPEKMIKSYHVLAREKGGMTVMREILKDKVKFSEDTLTASLNIYYEAQARRNLLVHRGREPDSIYYAFLKQSKVSAETRKSAFNKLYDRSTQLKELDYNKGASKPNPSDEPIDLSVTPAYLSYICYALLYVKESLVMDLRTELPRSHHALIDYGLKSNDDQLLVAVWGLFLRKVIVHLDSEADLELDEKAHYLFLHEHLLNEPSVTRVGIRQQSIARIIGGIHEDGYPETMPIKALLQNYVDKDQQRFLENTKKLLDTGIDACGVVQSWPIFKRYLEDNAFQALLESKRAEFKLFAQRIQELAKNY